MRFLAVLALPVALFVGASTEASTKATESPKAHQTTQAVQVYVAAVTGVKAHTALDTTTAVAQQVQQHITEKLAAEAAAKAAAQSQSSGSSGGGGGVPTASGSGSGGCASGGGGAWAVPEWIVNRESGGDYCARNPSGACGAYQIMPGTWGGYGGYASACDAPPAVQDDKASQMAPCNWVAPNYCAG